MVKGWNGELRDESLLRILDGSISDYYLLLKRKICQLQQLQTSLPMLLLCKLGFPAR